MKIITNNAVYVQNEDIYYLNKYLTETDLAIPESITMKVIDTDSSNRFEFVKFEALEEIKFFKGIDEILDYNEVKDLSEKEIIALGQNNMKEQHSIFKRFSHLPIEEREENKKKCDLLELEFVSLTAILWLKRGYIKIELPEGIDLPVVFEQEKGIRKLVKTIFNKR